LQNQTFRHRPQRSSLPPLLPQAWHELSADAIVDAALPGSVVLGPVAAGAASASATSCVSAPSAAQQLVPEWPWFAATN